MSSGGGEGIEVSSGGGEGIQVTYQIAGGP